MTARGDGAERRALEVDGRAVLLSNPDKVLYPATGFSKRDLVDYYLAVAPALLPYLAGAVAREVAREDPAGVTDRLPLAERAGKVRGLAAERSEPLRHRALFAPRRPRPSRGRAASLGRGGAGRRHRGRVAAPARAEEVLGRLRREGDLLAPTLARGGVQAP